MADNLQSINYGTLSGSADRNKVMRNTYWLLALSLVPTVLGAWIGVESGITRSLSGGLGMIVYLAIAFGFIFAIQKTKDSALGIAVLLGFTFFMGIMLSGMLSLVLHYKNGASLVMLAFGGTAGIFFGTASMATVIKRDLSGMGKWLFWGLMVLIVGGVVNLFVGSTAGMAVLSTLSMAIFSAYLLFDIKRVIDGGETNYISATLAIYLDLINIFQSLLSLLGLFGGQRD